MQETSTKPYLLRALYEWCTDNGYTPHIAVRVDGGTRVPMQFVRDGEIVLNIAFDATNKLSMGKDSIEFEARFGGKVSHIMVPVENVLAIYAKENGQGMAFPVEEGRGTEHQETAGEAQDVPGGPALVEDLDQLADDGEPPRSTGPDDGGGAPKGGRPRFTVVK